MKYVNMKVAVSALVVLFIASIVMATGTISRADAEKEVAAAMTQAEAKYRGTPTNYSKLPLGNYRVEACFDRYGHSGHIGSLLVASRDGSSRGVPQLEYYLIQDTPPNMCEHGFIFAVSGSD
jgi:hypothetical protein